MVGHIWMCAITEYTLSGLSCLIVQAGIWNNKSKCLEKGVNRNQVVDQAKLFLICN